MDQDNPNDLIPLGAPAPGFDVVIRGYDRAQVAEALERLEQDVRVTVGERDQAIARANQLHQQLESLSGEVTSLNEKIRSSSAPSFESMGERISSMLRLAEEEAADLRRSAQDDTSAMRTEAEQLHAAATEAEQTASQRASNVENKAKAHAEQTVADAQAKAAAHLEEARGHAAAHKAEAEEQAATLLAQSEAKRQRDEDDFEIALNARRSEAQRLETEREKSSLDHATKTVANADARASATVADADARATKLITDAKADSQRIRAETQRYCADLTAQTQATAARMTGEAEAEVHRLRTVRASVARQIMDVGSLIGTIPKNLAEDPAPLAAKAEGESAMPDAVDGTPVQDAAPPAPVAAPVGGAHDGADEAGMTDNLIHEVTVPDSAAPTGDDTNGMPSEEYQPTPDTDRRPASERTMQVSAVRPRRPSPGVRRQ